MKKQLVSLVLAVIMAAGLLTSCGSSNTSENNATAESSKTSVENTSTESVSGGELTIWLPPFAGTDADVTDEEFWLTQLQPLIDETGCSISIEIVPWDSYETKYLTGITSGEGPDIGYMYMEMFADYIDMGALAKLDEYFTDEEKANYTYFDKGNFNGVQYALPIVVGNPRILTANMDLLNAAGITKVPETLDELVSTSQALLKSNPDVYPLVQAWGDSHYGTLNEIYWPYFWAEGGSILNASGEPDVNTEAGIKAAQYIYDLKYKYNILSDSATSMNSDDALSLFESGKAAMAVIQSSDAANLDDKGINWGYSTYLQGAADVGGTFVAADSLILLDSCKNKELAAKAMKLMTSADVMEAFHEQLYSMPPISINEEYKDVESFKEMYANDTDHLITLPVFDGATTFYDTLFKNLQNMMLGDMTAEEVMKSTMDYYNESIKE